MSDKKIIKRAIEGVWDKVKSLRSQRAYAPDEIERAAHQLQQHAEELRDLGKRMSALSAMPPSGPTEGQATTAKRKRRKKAPPT